MKKKDIIQLVKNVVKENTFYGNREQPSTIGSTTAVVPTDEYPFSRRPKRTGTGMMETQGTLASDMLNYADQYHMELVDTMKGVSTYPDKRTGGFYIKFPHAEGPPNPALFGKETRMKIEASKAAAKAAAQKTVSKFQDQIEDYEITDHSQAGVYGSVHLWIMPSSLGNDYTAPKGGTQSSQFESSDYADRLANSGTDSDGRNTWGDKTGYSDEEMRQGKGKLKKYPDKDGRNVWGDKTDYSDEEKAKLKKEAPMFGKKEPFTKDYGSKISPEDFKSKMPVGKTVIYSGTRYKVLENTGYVLTLQSLETEKIKTVNLNQFISQGAIKEKTMKNIKEDITDDISKAEDEVQAATQAKADAESKVADARKKKADAEKSSLEEVGDFEGKVASQESMSNADIRALQTVVSDYSLNKVLNTLAVIADKTGKHDEADMIQKLASQIQDFDPSFEPGYRGNPTDMMESYIKKRGNSNLMEHMDKHRKRGMLMEGAMKRLFSMFDQGMTDEEIVQDHATKGVQVPEAFISKLRKQWEGLKKAKLEMEMAEKEYKNSSQPMVNNPDGTETGMEPVDNKQLASGLAY